MASVALGHIEITPGVCGGKPHIAGHRISVPNVVIQAVRDLRQGWAVMAMIVSCAFSGP